MIANICEALVSRKMKGINSLKNCWALAESRAVNVGIISPVPWLSAGDGASGMCCGSPKESFPLFLMGVGVVGVFNMWLSTELWVCKSLLRSCSIHKVISSQLLSQLLGQNLVCAESVALPARLKSSQCSFVHALPLLSLLLALQLP